jgi:DNA-binding MarR family transcriptional regulator
VEEPETLADAFWAVARVLRGRNKAALAPWEVTPSQFRALSTLERNGQLRLSALAERLRIAPRSATEVVDDLESRGLAARTPDPADRRATLVGLTEAGSGMVREVWAARRAESETLFAGLDEQDRGDLSRILRRLRDQDTPPGPDQQTGGRDAESAAAGGRSQA